MEETDNHNLNTYSQGETDWEHSSDMKTIEERLQIRDLDENLGNYSPHADATFIATDTGAVYDGDGESWNLATRKVKSFTTDQTDIDPTGTNGAFYTDGRIVEERYASWGQQVNYFDRIQQRDKAVVSFSFDDAAEDDYTDVFPEFRDRNLPWAENIMVGNVGGSSNLSKSQIDEMVAHGAEVVCHANSPTSLYDIADDHDALREEIIGAKRELEGMGYHVQGFLPHGQDGIEAATNTRDSNYDEYYSYLIRSAFDWSIGASTYGEERAVQFQRLHGDVKDYKLDSANDTAIIEMINHLIAVGGSVEFGGHPRGWGKAELTALQNVLDHCVTEQDNGNLVVTTPSTMRKQPRDPDDVNFAPNPGAEAYDSFGDDLSWNGYGNTPKVNTDGGADGSNYWVIGTGLGGTDWSGLRLIHPPWDTQFPCMMVQCDAKGAAGGESLAIRMADHHLAGGDFDRQHDLTTEWQTIRSPFGFHRTEGYPSIDIWTSSNEVHVDNIKIHPC